LNLQKREGKAEACVACKVEKQCTEVNYSKSQLRLPQGQMKCKECTLSSQLAASTVSGILCCGFTEPPSSLAPSGCTLSIRVAQPKLFAPLLPTPFPNTLKTNTNTPACWSHTLFYGPCLRNPKQCAPPFKCFCVACCAQAAAASEAAVVGASSEARGVEAKAAGAVTSSPARAGGRGESFKPSQPFRRAAVVTTKRANSGAERVEAEAVSSSSVPLGPICLGLLGFLILVFPFLQQLSFLSGKETVSCFFFFARGKRSPFHAPYSLALFVCVRSLFFSSQVHAPSLP
jgi:hypothetical protein